MDKAGKQYWDKTWQTYDVLKEVNPRREGLRNYINRRFHEYFCQIFSSINTQGKNILEIGCAKSVWLPYFAKEFGFNVYGIDYSEIGCQQALQILSKEGVKGEIVCADFLLPPEHMFKSYDVVVSFGVLEHFKDTTACIANFSKFLKPGGLLITSIPNLLGLNGLVQKIVNRTVFDIHVSIDINTLKRAHEMNDFQVILCSYFLFTIVGLVNIENLKGTLFYKVARVRSWINELVWSFERLVPGLKPNRWSSPYINCFAIKRQD